MDTQEIKLQNRGFFGKDEMNLAEFPITLLSKRHVSENKTIEFSDTIFGRENEIIQREWTVTGSDKFGLPLAQDNDIWMALIVLGKNNDFKSRKIQFSRYQICKIMNQKPGGSIYRRIEEALSRLSGVKVYAKNAFWDNEKRSYVTKGFGIIDDFELLEEHGLPADGETPRQSYVNLNETIFKSIKTGYIKSIDISLYFKLDSAISKRLYRYLDKKRYRKKIFEIDLFALAYTHLGFEEETYKYASLIKNKLNYAHEDLIKSGFLETVRYFQGDNKQEKVIYEFSDKYKNPSEEPPLIPDKPEKKPVKEKTQSCENIIIELSKTGITRSVAEQLCRDYPESRIKHQVTALPFRKAEDQAAVLVRAIQENWALPSGYIESLNSEEVKKTGKKKQEKEDREKEERRLKIEGYLASLSRDESAELTKEARETARKEGGAIFGRKEIPAHIVKAYIYVIVEKRIGHIS
jgi:hypothetical protein